MGEDVVNSDVSTHKELPWSATNPAPSPKRKLCPSHLMHRISCITTLRLSDRAASTPRDSFDALSSPQSIQSCNHRFAPVHRLASSDRLHQLTHAVCIPTEPSWFRRKRYSGQCTMHTRRDGDKTAPVAPNTPGPPAPQQAKRSEASTRLVTPTPEMEDGPSISPIAAPVHAYEFEL